MADGSVEFKAPNGTSFFVTMDGNDLWVRTERDEGSASLDWRPNAMNEGWIVQTPREAVKAAPIPARPTKD